MNETLYTYTVRNMGRIVFSSDPLPEDQAVLEAAKYLEVDVEEYETVSDEAEGQFDRQW
jgi:hypothetical protein